MKRTFPISATAALLLLVAGCSRQTTVNMVREPSRTVTPSPAPVYRPAPVYVPAPETAPLPAPAPEPEPARETIVPIVFAPRETEHVRITDYDPFGDQSTLAIDLDGLARHFHYPLAGERISNYGMRGRAMHTGVDIRGARGDTIRAALSGTVRMAKLYSSYGNIVVIRHPNGLETAYAHNTRNLVAPNDVVRAGDPIALTGRTGRATTEHLHFEVRVMGHHIDPNLLIDTEARAIRPGTLELRRQGGGIFAANAAAGQSTSPAVSSPASRQAATTADVHTVRSGDTLYALSRRYGLTVEQLCTLNGITPQGILRVGQRLKLK